MAFNVTTNPSKFSILLNLKRGFINNFYFKQSMIYLNDMLFSFAHILFKIVNINLLKIYEFTKFLINLSKSFASSFLISLDSRIKLISLSFLSLSRFDSPNVCA